MFDICYEELEQMIDDIKNDSFGVYLDTWDFEDEYSHNHIEENREKFIELANEYFIKEQLPFEAREVVENVYIFNKETGEVLYN